MRSTSTPARAAGTRAPPRRRRSRPGPLGRLGVWVTGHAKLVTVVWLLAIGGLGAFAPQVEHNLSGAGWQADGSSPSPPRAGP